MNLNLPDFKTETPFPLREGCDCLSLELQKRAAPEW